MNLDWIGRIIVGSIPLIIFLLSQFFSPVEVRSKKKKEHLYVLLNEVLLPLIKILRFKESDEIKTKSIEEINQIYDEYFYIIPETMNSRHEDILRQFKKICKYLKRKVGKFLETFSFDEHPRMTAFERLFKRKTKKILSRLSFYRGTEVNAKNEKDHIDSSKKRTDNQNQSNK